MTACPLQISCYKIEINSRKDRCLLFHELDVGEEVVDGCDLVECVDEDDDPALLSGSVTLSMEARTDDTIFRFSTPVSICLEKEENKY